MEREVATYGRTPAAPIYNDSLGTSERENVSLMVTKSDFIPPIISSPPFASGVRPSNTWRTLDPMETWLGSASIFCSPILFSAFSSILSYGAWVAYSNAGIFGRGATKPLGRLLLHWWRDEVVRRPIEAVL